MLEELALHFTVYKEQLINSIDAIRDLVSNHFLIDVSLGNPDYIAHQVGLLKIFNAPKN